MFFKINAECHIGFKKLTAADLGIGTSHQTHIGLYEGVLNFLPDVDVVSTAMRKRLSKYIFYSSFSLLTFATKK